MPLDQSTLELQPTAVTRPDLSAEVRQTITQLAILARKHQAAIKDQTALTNMIQARARTYHGLLAPEKGDRLNDAELKKLYASLITRREDPLFLAEVQFLLDPWEAADKEQHRLARQMGKLATSLPIWDRWAKDQYGFGAPGLGKIIGYAPGDYGNSLSDFETPAKLWRWFGHEVRDGTAPSKKRSAGKKLGFSPMRQAVLWNIGSSLVRCGIEKGDVAKSDWGQVFLDRKAYEIATQERLGIKVLPVKSIPKGDDDLYLGPDDGYISLGHVQNRAARYTRKHLLRRLWEEWNGLEEGELPGFLQV